MWVGTLLIVSLLNDGYWYGERSATIEFRLPVCRIDETVQVEWELGIAGVKLAGDDVRLAQNTGTAVLSLMPPCVRTVTRAEFLYRVRVQGLGVVESGRQSVVLHPTTILDGLARRLRERRVFVCETDAQLSASLRAVGIACQATTAVELAACRLGDILVVGEDQLKDDPFRESAIANLARGGVQIGLFRQGRVRRLLEYKCSPRPAGMDSEWVIDHPVLAGFSAEDLCRIARGAELLTLDVPPSDAGCVLGWSMNGPHKDARTRRNALAVDKHFGAGRVIALQVPMGRIEDDPRSALILRNMLDELNSPADVCLNLTPGAKP